MPLLIQAHTFIESRNKIIIASLTHNNRTTDAHCSSSRVNQGKAFLRRLRRPPSPTQTLNLFSFSLSLSFLRTVYSEPLLLPSFGGGEEEVNWRRAVTLLLLHQRRNCRGEDGDAVEGNGDRGCVLVS